MPGAQSKATTCLNDLTTLKGWLKICTPLEVYSDEFNTMVIPVYFIKYCYFENMFLLFF